MAQQLSDTTLIALAYDIRNNHRGGDTTTDDTISLRQIMRWVKDHYAFILHEELERLKKDDTPLPYDMWVDLGCVKLEEVDKAECSECKCIKWGCTVKKAKIPKLLSNNGVPYIKLYNLGMEIQYQLVSDSISADRGMKGSGRFKGLSNGNFWLLGDSLYIVLPPDFEEQCFVRPIAILTELPIEEDGCADEWQSELKIPRKFIPIIKERIFRLEMNMMVQTIPLNDENNNSISK